MSAPLLLSAREEPLPPTAVVDALRRVDPALSVRWVPFPRPYWAIVETWHPDHPKRALVRAGEVAEDRAFDLVAMLPPDCSVEDAVGFVGRHVRPVRDASADAQRMVHKLSQARADERRAAVEAVRRDLVEDAERTTSRDLALELGREPAAAQVIVPSTAPVKGRKRAA